MIAPNPASQGVCFKLAGEWDFTRRDELRAILHPAESLDEVFLDCSEVTFIDASILGCLVRLRRCMIEHNRLSIIRIVAASRPVMRLFEICDLLALFGSPTPTNARLVGNSARKLTMMRGSAFMT